MSTPTTPHADNPDPHGECRHEIERLNGECGLQARLLFEAESQLLDWENSAKMAADESCTADEKHCACVGLLRQSLAEARRLLDMAMCDVIPRSGLACDIEAFLRETDTK